ncbi:MAG: O-antigen ligase family protein [Acidimicrobiia bacterium]
MAAIVAELRQTRLHAPVVFAVGVVVLAVALLLGYGVWLAALAILVPTGVAVAVRPQRGVLILCALLPYDGIIKQFAPGWTNPWKQVLILGLLLLTFMCPEEARAPRGRRLPSWTIAFACLLALGIISAARVDTTTALVGLRLSYFSALIGLTLWRCPLNRRERDTFVTIFIAMATVTALVGLWQQVVGDTYLYNLGYAYNVTLRFTTGFTLRSFSTFNLPFPFAFYMMLALLIGLPMSLAEPRRLRSKVFFLVTPILLAGLFFTFVRGAMLGLAIGLLYLAFHRYKVLVYGIPIVLVAALFIPSGATLTTAVFSSNSLGDRTLSWGDRLDHFAENPFGTGIGTTGAAAEKAAQLNFTDPNATYVPDNSWLKVMFEVGVFGLWFFVLMIVSIFLSVRATERKVTGIDRDFLSGVGAQIVAVMVSCLVSTYLELVPMDQLFWVVIATAATMAPDMRSGPAVYRPWDASARRARRDRRVRRLVGQT